MKKGKTKLHPGAKWMFRLGAYMITLFPVIFLMFFLSGLLGFLNLTTIFLVGISAIVIIALIGEFYANMAYDRFFYEFTNNELKVERGIIWKRYSNIPYERVQNVDVLRGILARIFGFSSVFIQTAGYGGFYGRGRVGMHSEGYLPAVSIKDAEEIRSFITKKISGKKSGL
jgi:uncharacterized membrane protein YdbT with pleckstrin-like domain